MAQQQSQYRHKNEIGFQNVELLKNETLGVGSYGSVCKARSDHLLCAAKIIHPTLVPPNAVKHISHQREHRLPIRMFEMECDLLKEIRHPNIIQYLGMYRDPETGLPVLLMELMDESLTHFLESSTEPIPYHIQVNLCLDISRALSFLHLNGIIHRDLSSNNILLDGKQRAKLTDFGMAKLVNIDISRVSNTVCPGTDVYMPPEAVDNQAVYTEKGDVFSFGVNIIQILTRKFPKPGDRFKTVTSSDPQFPSGRVRVCTPEIERRNNHISEIYSTHTLLLIALDCLQDQESDRPSAGELCQKLAALKDAPGYPECGIGQELRQLSVSQLEDQVITARQQEIHDLREELSIAQGIVRERNRQQRNQEETIIQFQRRIEELELSSMPPPHTQSLSSLDMTRTIPPPIPFRRQRNAQQLPPRGQQPVQHLPSHTDIVRATPPHIPSRRQHLPPPTKNQLPPPPHTDKIRATPPPVASRRQKCAQQLPPLVDIARPTPPPIPSRGYKHAHCSNVEGIVRLNWTQGKKAPRVMRRWTDAVVDGSSAYFNPAGTREVYSYNSFIDTWSQLPDCPTHYSTLAIVNGLLTTVGGSNSNQLFTLYRRRKWTEVFPFMPTKRHWAIAVTAGRVLIVAGGFGYKGSLKGSLTTVEVLNINTRQWSTAASLPQPMYTASATVCGDHIYMTERNSVIMCSVPALLQSGHPKIFLAQPSTPPPQDPVWTTVAYHKARYSSLVSINNHLLAISGSTSEYQPTTAVRLYDPVNNGWQTISHLSKPRRLCFAVVLQDKRIMVVGGLPSKSIDCETDTVDFASTVQS